MPEETGVPREVPNRSTPAAPPVSRQFATVTTLAAYCTVLIVGITHHEPWADEAHAWLLSRELGYRYLVFHQLAYEGHPPLWYTILWVANHWFHLPYQSLGWIGGLCAIAGCWFFCRYSPFPLIVRILFPFTYFMAFQYAVVARPYVLLPLFAFAAAHFFEEAERRPWRFAAAVSALALLCAPGVMMALGLVAARGWYAFRSSNGIPQQTRKKLIGAIIAFAIVMGFIAFVNWPPADRITARFDRPPASTAGIGLLPRDLSAAFFGSAIPSAAFLLVAGAWCACRRRLLPFALPMALVLIFFIEVYGNLWHCGALTLITVVGAWIAWPSRESCAPMFQRPANVLMLVGITCLFAVQIYWSVRTLAMDYSRPYSGSLDAANFLRSVGADAGSTCGIGFHTSAIQPYFRKGIFQNWPRGEAFWRFDKTSETQTCRASKWIVVAICCSFNSSRDEKNDRGMLSYGYVPVHVSKGSLFFEDREAEPTDFVIYRLMER